MKSAPLVDVYATSAKDVVIYQQQNGRKEELAGGPAKFIREALSSVDVPFVFHNGQVGQVEILVSADGEVGNVRPFENKNDIEAPATKMALVSGLLQEWNVEKIASFDVELCIDAQGFVRSPGEFGKKHLWDGLVGDWTQQIKCFKATDEEARYLPEVFLEEQKKRLLLITRGKDGVEMYEKGVRVDLKPSRVVESPSTIGAGDFFFGTVVGQLVLGNDPVDAVKLAMEKTSDFLSQKNK